MYSTGSRADTQYTAGRVICTSTPSFQLSVDPLMLRVDAQHVTPEKDTTSVILGYVTRRLGHED